MERKPKEFPSQAATFIFQSLKFFSCILLLLFVGFTQLEV